MSQDHGWGHKRKPFVDFRLAEADIIMRTYTLTTGARIRGRTKENDAWLNVREGR